VHVDPILAAELERALLRALSAAWRDLNETHFKRAMQPPAIVLAAGATRYGEWRRATREIAMQRELVTGGEWGAVIEVLKHEMAHQYVAEVLGEPDPSAHGPAFRALCERLGIDARAVGSPRTGASPDAPSADEARVLGRIARLLALAESPNEHEAELAMAEAQRLMLKHNLEAGPPPAYTFRHLGRATGRVNEHERVLAGILGEHFFVECIWVPVWRAREGKRASVLEVCGTPVNLEMAAYVHAFLGHTAERLWDEYTRANAIVGRRDRRTFLAGVMTGFRDKLERERARHRREGLVWVGDADLGRFLRKRHPYVRFTRHEGPRRTDAHAHGRAAGEKVVLHRPVGAAASTRSLALPPRR
jgi:Protein of unknown function (DUF2786)/SprT-like family